MCASLPSLSLQRPYNFGFTIVDRVGGVRFSQEGRADEEGRVTGRYSYVRPDNVLVTVRLVKMASFHFIWASSDPMIATGKRRRRRRRLSYLI